MGFIKSPLRYPGGKSKVVEFLSRFFPDFKELREPMCGGASITLYWVQKKPQAKYVMGDINYDLFCFWKELKENPERLMKEIISIKKAYRDGRRLFEELMSRREKPMSSFERAVDFFILNRITFSGTVDSGGYSEEAFRKRFTESSIEKLRIVSKLLQRVEIVYGDYAQLLREEGENVVIFLDPPYYSARGSKLYGKRGDLHTSFDHERLYREVLSCKYRVMITYDNSSEIRKLYSGFYMVEWRMKYGMTNYGRNYLRDGEELIIANYPLKDAMKSLENQPALFQKVAKYYLP